MNKRKIMAFIHIAIAAIIVSGSLALCGCGGSNFDNAWAGGNASSSNGGCISAAAGCVGSTASNIACSGLTGCANGCMNFF